MDTKNLLRTKSILGRWALQLLQVEACIFVSQYLYRWFKLLLVLFCVFFLPIAHATSPVQELGIHIIQNTPSLQLRAGFSTEHNGLHFLILFLNILSLFLEMLDLEYRQTLQTNRVILTCGTERALHSHKGPVSTPTHLSEVISRYVCV